ncbi:MAG: hypothetical protein MHM6MM_006355 [Cercozoa sp. M6MM]
MSHNARIKRNQLRSRLETTVARILASTPCTEWTLRQKLRQHVEDQEDEFGRTSRTQRHLEWHFDDVMLAQTLKKVSRKGRALDGSGEVHLFLRDALYDDDSLLQWRGVPSAQRRGALLVRQKLRKRASSSGTRAANAKEQSARRDFVRLYKRRGQVEQRLLECVAQCRTDPAQQWPQLRQEMTQLERELRSLIERCHQLRVEVACDTRRTAGKRGCKVPAEVQALASGSYASLSTPQECEAGMEVPLQLADV